MTEEQSKLDYAYQQRNRLAVGLARMALLAGLPAGRGIDGKEENEMEWRHVVYVDLPNGEQLSWHMAPHDVYLLDGLPCYRGKWDGKFTGHEKDWPSLIPLAASPVEDDVTDEEVEAVLSGFALNRWRTERRKMQADPDVTPSTRNRILRGYMTAWAPKI